MPSTPAPAASSIGPARPARRSAAAPALPALALALTLAWAAPGAHAQGAPNNQVRWNGAASVTPPAGADFRVDQRYSSTSGTGTYAAATAGQVFAESFVTLTPLASITVRSFAGELQPQVPKGVSSAQASMSYSVVWTPSTGQYQAALTQARGRGSFGQVTGQALAQAEGRASARARLRAESGGFGLDGGEASNELLVVCGGIGQVAPAVGCGSRLGTLALYLAPLPDGRSFVGSIDMFASIETGGSSPDPAVISGDAFAFVDPLITLNPEWTGELVIGGGAVANAIPEPAAAWLLLVGLGAVAWRARAGRPGPRPRG